MSSAATQVANTISKPKDYDVFFNNVALEYTSWMLPGRSEASTYNLITNLRNIEESAGDRNTEYPHNWRSMFNCHL